MLQAGTVNVTEYSVPTSKTDRPSGAPALLPASEAHFLTSASAWTQDQHPQYWVVKDTLNASTVTRANAISVA